MPERMTAHIGGNVVGWVALCTAVAATACGAVGRDGAADPPAAFPTAAAARLAVAGQSTASPGVGGGPLDPSDPTAAAASGTIAARGRLTSPAVAQHGGSTDLPLTGVNWTQAASDLDLIAGSVVITTPRSCTGSFGNAVTLSVDGNATTFAAVPVSPSSTTLTMPFVIGTLSEPGRDVAHTLTAKLGNSCTRDGENYAVKAVSVDVLRFH